MNVRHIIQKDVKHKLPKGKTNWDNLRNMSEDEVLRRAKFDPDAKPLTKSELRKMQSVVSPENINVKKIRMQMKLSQSQFAAFFGISVRTLQEWEQKRRRPQGAARTLLIIIAREPLAVQRAFNKL